MCMLMCLYIYIYIKTYRCIICINLLTEKVFM